MKNKLYVLVVKTVFVLPLLVFGIWLLQMLFFPEVKATKPEAPVKAAEEDDIFRKILRQTEPVPRGHFHMVDEHIVQPEPFQPDQQDWNAIF